jgi:hypothetical protein
MTQPEIHAALDKMFENPKSRNFINHLVRSYVPTSIVDKVYEKPSGNFKCAITGTPLVSVQEILEGMETEEFKNDFLTSLKSVFEEAPQTESPIKKLIGEKKLGVTGKDTTTFLSYPAFQEFYGWVITKSLKGDKHINWLLGSVRRTLFLKRAEGIADPAVQDKVAKLKKAHAPKKVTTFNLGESNDVLAQLKAKLESNGN